MYHLSGISSLTNGGRSRSNSLVLSSSPPLSPSVLDFSEYVSRQCEKKLQRRVRQLSQRNSRQYATIQQLRRQLAASRPPLADISNATVPTPQHIKTADGPTEQQTAEETELLDNGEDEEADEETTESGLMQLNAASEGEEETAAGSEQEELGESVAERQEGQQHTAADQDSGLHEQIDCPPCSPISACRHKRGRTDDSELCNTELIDAQWKKAKEEDDTADGEEEEGQSDEQTAATQSSAATPPAVLATVHALQPFKPALLRPFPISHAQLHSHSTGSGLTPYRGLLRPFSLAQQTRSPVRITQPVL